MTTRWEVQDAVFASRMDPAGRHLMHALIAKATGNTVAVPADHAPNYDALAEMTGLSRSTVAEWMKALAAGGWFTREGGTTRAAGGYVLAVGDPDVALPKRASRISKKAISPLSGPKAPALEGEVLDSDGAVLVRSADQSEPGNAPPISPLSGIIQSAQRTKASPLSGLKRDAPIRNLPTGDAVPPDSPFSPSPGVAPVNEGHASVEGWRASDRKTAPAVVAHNSPRTATQSGLFSAKGLKLTEAQQVVYDWGRWNGYPDITEDDARTVHALVRAAFPGKATAAYLRGIAKPEGSGFGMFFEQVRKERAHRVEIEIRALESAHPECEHGTPAGTQPHPIHGTPLCPLCRHGADVARPKSSTDPDVVAAITAYRDAYDGPLTATEFVKLAQQAAAFHAEGASRDQLIELARRAAARDESLFVAATREDA